MSDSEYSCSGSRLLSICPICAESYFCRPSCSQHSCCLVYPGTIFSCAPIVIYPQMLMAPKDFSGACGQPGHSISLTVPYSALKGEKCISCPYFTQRNRSQMIIS